MYKCCISVKEIGGKCDAHTLVVEVLAVSAGSHRGTAGEGGGVRSSRLFTAIFIRNQPLKK